MKASVDKYYDDNRMADIFIKGTMGLTERDIEAVSSMEEVEQCMPARVTDTLMQASSDEGFGNAYLWCSTGEKRGG